MNKQAGILSFLKSQLSPAEIKRTLFSAAKFPGNLYRTGRGALRAKRQSADMFNAIKKHKPELFESIQDAMAGGYTGKNPVDKIKDLLLDAAEKASASNPGLMDEITRLVSSGDIEAALKRLPKEALPSPSFTDDILKLKDTLGSIPPETLGNALDFAKASFGLGSAAGSAYLFNQLFLGGGRQDESMQDRPRTLTEQLDLPKTASFQKGFIHKMADLLADEYDVLEQVIKDTKVELKEKKELIKSEDEYAQRETEFKKQKEKAQTAQVVSGAVDSAIAAAVLVNPATLIVTTPLSWLKNKAVGAGVRIAMEEAEEAKKLNRRIMKMTTKEPATRLGVSNKRRSEIWDEVLEGATKPESSVHDYAKKYHDIKKDIQAIDDQAEFDLKYKILPAVSGVVGGMLTIPHQLETFLPPMAGAAQNAISRIRHHIAGKPFVTAGGPLGHLGPLGVAKEIFLDKVLRRDAVGDALSHMKRKPGMFGVLGLAAGLAGIATLYKKGKDLEIMNKQQRIIKKQRAGLKQILLDDRRAQRESIQ